jgi:hypothetical protein
MKNTNNVKIVVENRNKKKKFPNAERSNLGQSSL